MSRSVREQDWREEMWKMEAFRDKTGTCPMYLKHEMCKHSINIQIRRKEVQAPLKAKNRKFSQKKKHEKPSKAKQALLI